MQFEFHFPQMATETTPRGGVRYRILPDKAVFHIPEVSLAEAPVAVEFADGGENTPLEIRYMDGRFFYQCRDEPRSAIQDKIIESMMENFGDLLISKRHTSKSIYADKTSLKTDLWRLWRVAKRTTMNPVPSTTPGRWDSISEIGNAVFDGRVTADGAHYEKDWTKAVMEIVQSMLFIDGQLWLPTSQPVFWLNLDHAAGLEIEENIGTNWLRYGNIDAFKCSLGPGNLLPKPYGRDSSVVYVSKSWNYYWEPEWLCIPIPESTEHDFNIDSSKARILIPEAFNSDLSALMIERMARIAVVCIYSFGRWMAKTHERHDALVGYGRRLFQETKNPNMQTDVVKMADLLHQVGDCINSNIDFYIGPLQFDLIRLTTGIEHALKKWEDREININITGNQNVTQPKLG